MEAEDAPKETPFKMASKVVKTPPELQAKGKVVTSRAKADPPAKATKTKTTTKYASPIGVYRDPKSPKTKTNVNDDKPDGKTDDGDDSR